MITHDQVFALVKASVELAIVRHDLATEDTPTMSAEDMASIALDVWKAMLGIDTCADDMVPELAVILEHATVTRESLQRDNPAIAHTWDWDEHPENYEGDCYCQSCREYMAEG